MRFKVTFSTTTGKSAVHHPDCRVVAAKKRGVALATVIATTPELAAAAWNTQEDDLVARGYPYPTVCGCAMRGPKVLADMLRFP